jgi:hypothetical protein
MWAMKVTVKVPEGAFADADEARQRVTNDVVPAVKAAPGFVRGVWAQHESGRGGMGFVLFDNEEHARAAAEGPQVGGEAPGGAIVSAVDIFEVLVEA